jgi:exonuclease SbcC
MIPHKLFLQNFLSYKTRQEPLDFSQMHLAVLVGRNGHGKSALLDAITWALWGKARAADDALMHLGSSEMQVDFEFMLNEQRYRVERKRHRRGKASKPRLDLFIWDEGAARWQPLTESNVRATQRKIEDLLRMDYETFVHTAFLKQGEADAFTTASPKERKLLLGKVLNLEQYEKYAAQARETAKDLNAEVNQLEGRLKGLMAELARREDYEKAIHQAKAVEVQAKLRMNQTARAASDARLALQDLENKEAARLKLARRVESARRGHRQTEDELNRAQKTLTELEAWLGRKEEIARQLDAWRQASEESNRWNQVLAELHPLKEEESALLQAIQQARAELETDLALKERRLQEAQSAAADLPAMIEQVETLQKETTVLTELEAEDQARRARLAALDVEMKQARKELIELEKQLSVIPRRREERARIEKEVEALKALEAAEQARQQRLSELRVMVKQAEVEIQKLQEAVEDVKSRRDLLISGETDACPVCHRPLGEDGREHVLEEYAGELAALQAQIDKVRSNRQEMVAEGRRLKKESEDAAFRLKRLPGLQRQLAQLESFLESEDGDFDALSARQRTLNEALEKMESERKTLSREQDAASPLLRELPGKRQALGRLESRLGRLRDLAAPLASLQEEVDALKVRLKAGALPETQQRLQEISARLASLRYDENAHHRAQQALKALDDIPAQWQRVQDAERRLPEASERVARLEARWQEEMEVLREDEAELDALAKAARGLPAARRTWQEAQQAAEEAHRAWEQAHGELAAAEQRLAALAGVRQQKARLEEDLTRVRSQKQRYLTLAQAFGRDGVQAMIIEAALPELETEANRLLARLSDGRMNVRLQTQREKKSGGVKEALDIIISDELGSRPYELYSGGEAFRVDLALRIALSRLLARRAGASLQTLFIDEGFGTQDAQGRENLVEAIHMIKDEFALILVITHIDELKDQFPVRILVEKTGAGSTYRIG